MILNHSIDVCVPVVEGSKMNNTSYVSYPPIYCLLSLFVSLLFLSVSLSFALMILSYLLPHLSSWMQTITFSPLLSHVLRMIHSVRRGLSHGGSTDSMSSYRASSPWDMFYEHNDISISELISPTEDTLRSCSTIQNGTFCADCNISLSPKEIRHILLCSPERVDGLMTRRRVLNRLNDETFVQVHNTVCQQADVFLFVCMFFFSCLYVFLLLSVCFSSLVCSMYTNTESMRLIALISGWTATTLP